jgi:CRP-like cAMP-binding protein
VSDCLIASAKKENIKALVSANPDFAMNMINTLIDRLQMSEKILVKHTNEK